jgi:hypothetical protein
MSEAASLRKLMPPKTRTVRGSGGGFECMMGVMDFVMGESYY